MMSLTSSAYAVAASGWSALYLPRYTSGLGAWAEDERTRWFQEPSGWFLTLLGFTCTQVTCVC